MGETYGHVIQFRKTASSSTYCTEGETLVEDQAIFILVLQLDLFIKVSVQMFLRYVTNSVLLPR